MWFFNKKELKKEADPLAELYEAEQKKCFDLYPLGTEFDYMGVKLKVTANVGYKKGLYTMTHTRPTVLPHIDCDYVNLVGEIKNKCFCCSRVNEWME